MNQRTAEPTTINSAITEPATVDPITSEPTIPDPTSKAETTAVDDPPEVTRWGDANDDKRGNVADAVAVLQYIANKEKYPLSVRGAQNADCDGIPEITGSDAIYIQKIDAGII